MSAGELGGAARRLAAALLASALAGACVPLGAAPADAGPAGPAALDAGRPADGASPSDSAAEEAGAPPASFDGPRPFDYFVLSLSWSPAFCSGRGEENPEQCGQGRRFGFIAHGLWPQFAPTGYPTFCATRAEPVPEDVVARMLPLMPGSALIAHEWQKHGTCSGLDVRAYFDAVADAFTRVAVPPALAAPVTSQATTARQLRAAFVEANPGLAGEGLAIVCASRELAEVRVCLDRALAFRACGADVRDRCDGEVSIRPVP